MPIETIRNYVGGKWVSSKSTKALDVRNPATDEIIARVPLSTREEVNKAVSLARKAFSQWRETPPLVRARYFFKFKNLFEENFEDISRLLVKENGKTLPEARGSVRRAIENVEVAAGIPSLMMGYSLEDIAKDIDCVAMRQPLGVFACVTPFNFPAMVPLWFFPYAMACGNTFVVKPSEQTPLCQNRIFELMHDVGFPPGVVNLVNGAKEAVDALLEHPDVCGISFVGSSPVARYVYSTASLHGKRVQALGGAKNFLVVMPDADLDNTVATLIDSCFGCAGERCLAGSLIVAVGDVYEAFKEKFLRAARKIVVGNGLDEKTTMGPVISKKHRDKIVAHIDSAVREGAKLLLDGRGCKVADCPKGYFVGPTVFEKVTPSMSIAKEEIFGPVVCLMRAKSLQEALDMISRSEFGNATSIFTQNGGHARKFAYNVGISMIGINIGIAAPMAFFTFGGSKGSFFGDLKAHGRDSIEFFTDKRVIISRWF
ncbi:MAG: CoA-acylating methylmalonate-semialdehyde dehydrogenase [Candidatus Eisenbacteria bacterium]|nr:CoA-acylating methylmalonate-semialdehyde dehydrogenase [Candidatus Eisenbacteria bacterium]